MLTDARALQPDYVPETLQHRNGKVDELRAALDPLRAGDSAEHVFIHGPSGAGKTTLARHTLRRLRKNTLRFDVGYVNCLSASTATGALSTLLRDAGMANDLRQHGTPTSAFLDRLRERDEPFVAVLDEVDALAEPRLLYSLYETPGVSFILISVDYDAVLARLENRVRSRVQTAVPLRLAKYSHGELVDILGARAQAGLRDGAVASEALEAIADRAAGNARLAIAILRRAAREGNLRNLGRIDADLVAAVAADAREAMRENHVRTLGTHQRLLFEIIREAETIAATELHDRYERRADDPKSRSQRRRYLASLERYDLVEKRGDGRATEYVAVTV